MMSGLHPAFSPESLHPVARWLQEAGVRDLTADSRDAGPARAFAAYPGSHRDGRQFVAQALQRGAPCILWDPEGAPPPELPVPLQVVPQLKQSLSQIAGDLFGRPAERLWMVGITGTNGKTSSALWTAQSLEACGRRCGLIGTLGSGFPGALSDTGNTTPDAIVVQRTLHELLERGALACAMEVSSHGLDQRRVEAVKFDVALFTNLTRDHLDYHGSMEAYGAAKARLFSWPRLKSAVINVEDPFGLALASQAAAAGADVLTYGIGRGDLQGRVVRMDGSGFELDLNTPAGSGTLSTRLVGQFNVSNVLGVLGVLLASGVSLAAAIEALSHREAVPGRMQVLGGPAAGQPTVIIDYAHTPDALEKALLALRPLVGFGCRLFCVFGCGGDRDRGKRPVMGEIAARLAHRVIVTSDNPRTEAPHQILDDIIAGMGGAGGAGRLVVEDRRAAILAAVREARAGDVVLIAGKGHESYQEIAGTRHPFSDLAVAAEGLARQSQRNEEGEA